MSELVWQGFLDEAEHRDERMALIRAVRQEGDRLAFDLLKADFAAWRETQRQRMAFLSEQ